VSDLLARLKSALADRYHIEHELGSGGMATVYLAEDVKHHRQVAVKVLRPELAAALGPERFLREIEIAAALHHPHILPLYDSGSAAAQQGGSPDFLFYVMPYVEGESLRDRLEREKQLAIDDALQIAREVADALSYAHSRGVIHRDIKPENILLESGHAVVADFGIARAVDVAGGERLTETGIALGTPTYMSPEQAAGSKDLDGRSDLYSLGCVLHEMLAGQPPFTGPTVESVVHQHLSAEPPSVTAIRPSVPGWVAAALERSLAKTPADRFNPVAQFGEAISPRASVTGDMQPVPAPSSRRWLVPGIAAAALLIVIAVVLVRMLGPTPISITTSNIRAVTSEPGLEFHPAISPDGEEVAYVAGTIANPRLVVRSTHDVGSGGGLRLGEDVSGLHWLPRWAPDGSSLTFLACPTRTEGQFRDCAWKEVGKLGGSAQTVSLPWRGRWAWSRDGTRVGFAVGFDSIFVYSVEDGETELLGVNAATHPWTPHSLAWSPDGRRIAYVNGNSYWRNTLNVANASIWILDANGGDPVPVTDEMTMNVSPQWLPDSRHLLFVSNRDGPRGVYVVEVGPDGPRGPPRSLPGSSDPHSISVSANGRRLAYARFPAAQNVWAIPIPQAGVASIKDAVPVTEGNQLVEAHSLSRDGEWIVFNSNLRGELDLYKQRLAGGSQQPVADVVDHAFNPDWSPDGTEIVFYGTRLGTAESYAEVLVVPADGGTPEQLTSYPGHDMNPKWSPDGLSISFDSFGPQGLGRGGVSREAGLPGIWIVSRDSVGGAWGEPVPLTDSGNCQTHDWAPDGGSLVCAVWQEGLARVSTDGEILWTFDPRTLGLQSFSFPRFSPDGSRIYLITADETGSRGVWWIPANLGDATKVVAFDEPSLTVHTMFTVGPEHIYLTIGKYESDIWVMDLEW
jgi:Tol biopolymer transport system component